MIIDRYTAYLLEGYTIKDKQIAVSTIRGYLHAVNSHYISLNLSPPFDHTSHSASALMLKRMKSFQDKSDQREPLHCMTISCLHALALAADPLGFEMAVWYWTALGRLGGFRCQEFAMDTVDTIRVYVKPDSTHVTRAFTLCNFISKDNNCARVPWRQALATLQSVHTISTEYDIQKIQSQRADHLFCL